jgi:arylsulfatase A-like enzyme
MADDQGWGDVGYNDKARSLRKNIKTPVLDDMAAKGLRLDRFYSAQAVCSPTRGSVLTGRHPNRYSCYIYGKPLRPREMTVAQALKAVGYATGHFGKWHLNGVSGPGKLIPASDPLNPGRFGFDEWFSTSNFFDADWSFSHNGQTVKTTGDGSDAVMAEALKFMAKAKADSKPFLAVVWFGSPHKQALRHRRARRHQRHLPDHPGHRRLQGAQPGPAHRRHQHPAADRRQDDQQAKAHRLCLAGQRKDQGPCGMD